MANPLNHSPYCRVCKSDTRKAKYKADKPRGWRPRQVGDKCPHDWPKYAKARAATNPKQPGALYCTECKKESWQRTQTTPEARERIKARKRELHALKRLRQSQEGG